MNREFGSKHLLLQEIYDPGDEMDTIERSVLKKEATRIGEQLGKEFSAWDVKNVKIEAKENLFGILVNHYYGKEEEFSKNENLVKELQTNLTVLKYDLGEKGVDADFGTKSKIALGNFEVDYSDELREFAENKQAIQDAIKGKFR